MIDIFDFYDVELLMMQLNKLGYTFHYTAAMKSTMDFYFTRKIDSPSIVLTNHQTSGRGRYSNKWKDEKGKSILLTIVEKDLAINALPANIVSNLFALRICMTLNRISGCKDISIKWPNDLMLFSEKIGGILVERSGDSFLIGLGLNVYKNNEIGKKGYLKNTHISLSRQSLVIEIIKAWSKLKKEFQHDSFEKKRVSLEASWQENSFLFGKKIFVNCKNFSALGMVRSCLLDGGLILESDNKKIYVSENEYTPGSCVIF